MHGTGPFALNAQGCPPFFRKRVAAPDLDRVRIAVDSPITSAPGPAVDVDAADLTTERWVLRDLVSSTAGPGTSWAMVRRTHGTIQFDRDGKFVPRSLQADRCSV